MLESQIEPLPVEGCDGLLHRLMASPLNEQLMTIGFSAWPFGRPANSLYLCLYLLASLKRCSSILRP